MLCYIVGGKDYQVYNAAWKEDQWNYLTKDEDLREEAVSVTVIALLCELPHLLAWLLYVWARFYPSSSNDVVIGYVQAKKEEQEKEGKDTIRNLEEEKRKNALEAEARRIKEMEEDRAFRQMELGRNRNFLIAVKCD